MSDVTQKRPWSVVNAVERGAIEWPTVILVIVIHGLWLAATYFSNRIPLGLLIAIGGWVTAWHGSLQHEVIHGHPTRWRRLNAALAGAPLSLWLPFQVYRRSHLEHHASEALTDPLHDPESRYLRQGGGAAFMFRARLARLQGPLLGRLTLGPLTEIGGFLVDQFRAAVRGDPGARAAWAAHGLSLAPVLVWLHFACHLSLIRYGFCFVYPGTALSLLRSFAEHRSDPAPSRRVAVVERAPIFGLLFLNNNLHAAHHAWPGAPWFKLGRLYVRHRNQLLTANGALLYAGYGDVARRFLFRAHDRIDYPYSANASECRAP